MNGHRSAVDGAADRLRSTGRAAPDCTPAGSSCALEAAADRSGRTSTVEVANGYRADRIGWRELTATGHGVHPVDPPIPARSVSDWLRAYPTDLLGSPLDQRSARLRVEPGDGPPPRRERPG